MNPPEMRRPRHGSGADARNCQPEKSYNDQWARVPEWVAYKDLDATALKVLIILAAKAGRERITWMSNRTIADRLTAAGSPIQRRGVGKAIHRLAKVGVIEEVGRVIVDLEQGTWVKKYRVVDKSPGQPEVPQRYQRVRTLTSPRVL